MSFPNINISCNKCISFQALYTRLFLGCFLFFILTDSYSNIRIDTTLCTPGINLSFHTYSKNFPGSWSILNSNFKRIKTEFSPDSSLHDASVKGLDPGINYAIWTYRDSSDHLIKDTLVIFYAYLNPMVESHTFRHKSIICSDADTLIALIPKIGTGHWSSMNGIPVISDPSKAQTLVTGLTTGQNIFTWTVTYLHCLASVNDTVYNDLPSAARIISEDTSTCLNTTLLRAASIQNGKGLWSLKNPSELIKDATSIDKSTDHQTWVKNLLPGANVIYWTVSSSCGKASRDSIQVLYTAPSTAKILPPLPYSEICSDSITLRAAPILQGSGEWFLKKQDQVSIKNLSETAVLVSHLNLGSNWIYWQIRSGNICSPSVDSIDIKNLLPSLPVVLNESESSICTSFVHLRAEKPLVGTGIWVKLIRNLLTGKDEERILQEGEDITYPLNPDTNIFKWKITANGCPSVEKRIVVLNLLPPLLSAGTDQEICSDKVILTAQSPTSSYSGNWTIRSGSTGIILNKDQSKTEVINLSKGKNIFYWNVFHKYSRLCGAQTDSVIIDNRSPSQAIITQDSLYTCLDSVMVSAVAPSVGSGNWNSRNANVRFSAVKSSSTYIQNILSGSTIIYWNVINDYCIATDSIIIKNRKPEAFTAGKDTVSCIVNSSIQASWKIIQGQLYSGRWKLVGKIPSTSAQIENPTSATAMIRNMNIPGEYHAEWTLTTEEGCLVRDTVKITVPRFDPNETVDVPATCSGEVILQAKPSPFGKGYWSVIYGNGEIVSPDSSFTVIRNLAFETPNVFMWKIANIDCLPSTTYQVKNLRPSRQAAIRNPEKDTSFCEKDSVTLEGTAIGEKGNEEISYWLYNGKKVSASPGLYSFKNLLYAPEKNNIKWVVQNGVCPPSVDSINLLRYQQIAPPVISEENNVSCAFSDVTHNFLLTISNTPDNYQELWKPLPNEAGEIAEGTIVNLNNGSAKTILIRKFGFGQLRYLYEISNGECSSSDTVVLNALKYPAPPRILLPKDTSICELDSGNPFYINVQSTDEQTQGFWQITGGGYIASEQKERIKLQLADDTNTVYWTTYLDQRCMLTDSAHIYVVKNPAATSAGDNMILHDSYGQLSANTPESGAIGYWQIIKGEISLSDTTQPKSAFTNLGLGKHKLTWNTTNTVCPVKSDTVEIERIEFQIPKAFTPNHDGNNDAFVIKGVENYTPRELYIYNRWGEKVYYSLNYNNNWEGVNEEDQNLEDDTYFYVLKLRNEKVMKGFVLIKR